MNSNREGLSIQECLNSDLSGTINSDPKEIHNLTENTKREEHPINIKISHHHKKVTIEPVIEEKVPFSKHNKSLPFSKYLPRKAESSNITIDIPYLTTNHKT